MIKLHSVIGVNLMVLVPNLKSVCARFKIRY